MQLQLENLPLPVGQSGLPPLPTPLEVHCWLELLREEHITLVII
jgi:hypothetical protein